MIRTLRHKTVLRTFPPSEADSLAKELLSCSRLVDSYRQEINRTITELSAAWSGNQKDAFLASLPEIPNRLTCIFETCTSRSNYFQNLDVTVEETASDAV
jgi:uncharacterized protein YukE